MNILRVGDPHAKVNNLDEMTQLIGFVCATAKDNNVDRIEILGDLFHTHAVIRLEVQQFWLWAFHALSDVCETVVLVGNHDISGNYNSNFSSLSVFATMNKKNLIIVEKPIQLGLIGYMPYIHDVKTFIDSAKALQELGAKGIVCHQTIQGARYESGFYAADGVPTGDWSAKFEWIISGHIHAEQRFENIIYPGTARWDSISDANQRKGIWLFNHEEQTGRILGADFISTDKVCSPIASVQYREGGEEPALIDGARTTVELIGSSDWIAQQKQKYKGVASLKTKITDLKKLENRNTGGNFSNFLNTVFQTNMAREDLLKYAKELGIV